MYTYVLTQLYAHTHTLSDIDIHIYTSVHARDFYSVHFDSARIQISHARITTDAYIQARNHKQHIGYPHSGP